MMDGDNPASHLCIPEGLLQQARGLLINNGSLGCCFIGTRIIGCPMHATSTTNAATPLGGDTPPPSSPPYNLDKTSVSKFFTRVFKFLYYAV
ncbi:hypothetical protein FF2_029598 [Malus domestica]